MNRQPTVVAQPLATVDIMSSQPMWWHNQLWCMCWVGSVGIYMLWEAVVQYNKYCTIHNTDTVACTTHSGSYSTGHKRKYTTHWYTCGTQQLQRCTTFIAVHNTYMTQKPLGYLNIKLPQPWFQYKHFNISVLGEGAQRNTMLMLTQNKPWVLYGTSTVGCCTAQDLRKLLFFNFFSRARWSALSTTPSTSWHVLDNWKKKK